MNCTTYRAGLRPRVSEFADALSIALIGAEWA